MYIPETHDLSLEYSFDVAIRAHCACGWSYTPPGPHPYDQTTLAMQDHEREVERRLRNPITIEASADTDGEDATCLCGWVERGIGGGHAHHAASDHLRTTHGLPYDTPLT